MSERIAVVTGAARGIGLAVAEALLADGWTVVGLDVDEPTLSVTGQRLAAGAAFTPMAGDLTDPETVARLFSEIRAAFGGVDLLVNNAGTCFMNDFVDISAVELRQQVAINFDSAFYCCQQAISLMLPRSGIKKIVNISSNGAYNFDVFDPAHYRASKAALDNLTKHLARRTAHGCAHDGIGDEVWAVWLSPDHGAVTGRGLARESQARGTVVASGRVESAAETAETRPLVAGGWVLCAPPTHIPSSRVGVRLRGGAYA